MNLRDQIQHYSQFLAVEPKPRHGKRPIVQGHGAALEVVVVPLPEYVVWVAKHEDATYSAVVGGEKWTTYTSFHADEMMNTINAVVAAGRRRTELAAKSKGKAKSKR